MDRWPALNARANRNQGKYGTGASHIIGADLELGLRLLTFDIPRLICIECFVYGNKIRTRVKLVD